MYSSNEQKILVKDNPWLIYHRTIEIGLIINNLCLIFRIFNEAYSCAIFNYEHTVIGVESTQF